MAMIARALLREFPEHADLFGIGELQLDSQIIRNHNGLLGRYPGADGMKTGFTCAAGFNVVATANHYGRRLITVVLGSPSAKLRNQEAADLFDRGFAAIGGGSEALEFCCRRQAARRTVRTNVCLHRSAAAIAAEEDEGGGGPVIIRSSGRGGAVVAWSPRRGRPSAPSFPTSGRSSSRCRCSLDPSPDGTARSSDRARSRPSRGCRPRAKAYAGDKPDAIEIGRDRSRSAERAAGAPGRGANPGGGQRLARQAGKACGDEQGAGAIGGQAKDRPKDQAGKDVAGFGRAACFVAGKTGRRSIVSGLPGRDDREIIVEYTGIHLLFGVMPRSVILDLHNALFSPGSGQARAVTDAQLTRVPHGIGSRLLGFLAPQPPSAKTGRRHPVVASGSAGPLPADPLFFSEKTGSNPPSRSLPHPSAAGHMRRLLWRGAIRLPAEGEFRQSTRTAGAAG